MNFSGTTLVQKTSDKRRMATTVVEGMAPKPVQVNAEASERRSNSGNAKYRATLLAYHIWYFTFKRTPENERA